MDLQNVTFRWTEKREQAAKEVAEDRLTDEELSRNLGISRQTLAVWKRHPEFRTRVEEIISAYRAAVLSSGIARVENRIRAKHDRWRRLIRLVEARAADRSMQEVPGGDTGVIVRQIKSIGFGKDSRIVEEFATDGVLLRAMNDLEKEAAQDLGQWADKHELSGPDGGPIPIAVLDMLIQRADMATALEVKHEQRALNSGQETVQA